MCAGVAAQESGTGRLGAGLGFFSPAFGLVLVARTRSGAGTTGSPAHTIATLDHDTLNRAPRTAATGTGG
ncbi:hypothetical protein ACFV2X_46925 [Streptomyces sp. NPDC059679]|uniref:hypothetical protein n=1 Tax=Streptomyces sp. NPDC059679 TaxID=3346903 RepID=UPI0036897426